LLIADWRLLIVIADWRLLIGLLIVDLVYRVGGWPLNEPGPVRF
jgi:hypothetical protein